MTRQALVIYDGTCQFCQACRRVGERLDWLSATQWVPSQSGIGAQYGISEEATQGALQYVSGGRVVAGFRAVKRILLRLPATYLGAAGLMLICPPLWVAGVCVALASPISNPPGEAGYRWVARRRRRFCNGSFCAPDSPR